MIKYGACYELHDTIAVFNHVQSQSTKKIPAHFQYAQPFYLSTRRSIPAAAKATDTANEAAVAPPAPPSEKSATTEVRKPHVHTFLCTCIGTLYVKYANSTTHLLGFYKIFYKNKSSGLCPCIISFTIFHPYCTLCRQRLQQKKYQRLQVLSCKLYVSPK